MFSERFQSDCKRPETFRVTISGTMFSECGAGGLGPFYILNINLGIGAGSNRGAHREGAGARGGAWRGRGGFIGLRACGAKGRAPSVAAPTYQMDSPQSPMQVAMVAFAPRVVDATLDDAALRNSIVGPSSILVAPPAKPRSPGGYDRYATRATTYKSCSATAGPARRGERPAQSTELSEDSVTY